MQSCKDRSYNYSLLPTVLAKETSSGWVASEGEGIRKHAKQFFKTSGGSAVARTKPRSWSFRISLKTFWQTKHLILDTYFDNARFFEKKLLILLPFLSFVFFSLLLLMQIPVQMLLLCISRTSSDCCASPCCNTFRNNVAYIAKGVSYDVQVRLATVYIIYNICNLFLLNNERQL